MSLYEPSVRSSSWSISQRFSRPLTTLEGWREISAGVYTMNSSIRFFSIAHQFDPEQHRDDRASFAAPPSTQRTGVEEVPPVPSIPRALSVKSYAYSAGRPESAVAMEIASPGSLRTVKIGGSQEPSKSPSTTKDTVLRRPYHILSYRKKWLTVGIITVAGMLPGLALSMSFPALVTIANDLNMDLDSITLTITSYLAFQGTAVLFWGPISERFGRRPTYLMSLLLFVTATAVLSLSPNYPVLIIFRGIQAASIASTVSLGSSVIQDISQNSERDTFMNFYQCIRNVTIILSPILGGLLSNFFNFRAIFIFLLSVAIGSLIISGLFLPETLRSIAGNGSVRLTGIHKPMVYSISSSDKHENTMETTIADEQPKLLLRCFLEPLQLLREKDIFINLVSGAIFFTMWLMVTVSTTGLFRKTFKLNDLLLGLAFIPSALGTIVGSTLMGNLLNRDIIMAFSKYKAENELPPAATLCMNALPADFPLEHTRLRRLPWIAVCFTFSLCGYGFTLVYPAATSRPGWIAVPLFLQFVISATAHARCAVHQTLVSDLWHQNGHASTAASTFVKCFLAAFGVGLIQTILNGIGAWSTFLALGLVVMAMVPLPLVQWYWGREWRAEREAKREIIERFTKV